MTTTETQSATAQLRFEDLSDMTEIGRGAAATVYRCTGPDGRRRALKLFHAVTEDDAAAEQFHREEEALDHLPRHPAIISMEGRGRTDDGRPFLLLELTEDSLRTMVAESGPQPWADAVTMANALVGALETAHRAGVVHGDVSPSNIHQVDGRWKLADFGSSVMEHGESDGSGRPFTLEHAPPEAIRGEPSTISRDIYGLASTLSYALAGEAPFGAVDAASPEDITQRIETEPVPDLRSSDVPDALCQVIERAMSKDPDLRPASAARFGEDLAAAADREDLALVPPLVLAPVTEAQTISPRPADVAPTVAPRGRSTGRFASALVGAAAAALAVGAAMPVIADAVDDGPSSLFRTVSPSEVAIGADGDDEPATDDTAAEDGAADDSVTTTDESDGDEDPPEDDDAATPDANDVALVGTDGGAGGNQGVANDGGNIAGGGGNGAPAPAAPLGGNGGNGGNGGGGGNNNGGGNNGGGGGGNPAPAPNNNNNNGGGGGGGGGGGNNGGGGNDNGGGGNGGGNGGGGNGGGGGANNGGGGNGGGGNGGGGNGGGGGANNGGGGNGGGGNGGGGGNRGGGGN